MTTPASREAGNHFDTNPGFKHANHRHDMLLGYSPVAQNIANIPTMWQPATLVSDTAGQALSAKIQGYVPNISPIGVFMNFLVICIRC